MDSVSHLAGASVCVDGRHLRQLCQWCGHRLVDEDLQNIAVEGSSTDKPYYPKWQVGGWVRVDGPMRSAVENEDGKMPIDSCMRDVSPRLRVVEG